MRRFKEHRAWLYAVLAVAALLPGAFLAAVGHRHLELAPSVHFGMVVASAALVAAASVVLSVAGVRRRDGRTVLLGTAFSTMCALLVVHGFSTPGVVVGTNGVVSFAGGASLPAGAAILALSALPPLRRPQALRRIVAVQVLLGALVLALGATALLEPALVPSVPAPGTTEAVAVLVVGAVLYLLLMGRALRTFALTHRPADLTVAIGCLWCGLALVPQLLWGYEFLGFYVGHMIELAGLGMIAVPAALDLVRGGGASRPLVGDLSATEIVLAEEAFLGPRVRSLLVSLEAKDTSTEQHTRRVALLAVRVGEQLRLAPATLRHLAVGGLLHDIGKLAVPEHILRKPGALTDDEFAEIKKHPDAGLKLLHDLGGFPDQVHRLVHEHHERLDGSGYPRGIGGVELGFAPRILAVCDVFDALTSDRVYRDAWDVDEALALLRRDAGTHFDGQCVHALEKVLAQDVRSKRATPAVSPSTTSPRSASRSRWPSTSLSVK
jgi:putative nucleotidyltransferase with HDIG domain